MVPGLIRETSKYFIIFWLDYGQSCSLLRAWFFKCLSLEAILASSIKQFEIFYVLNYRVKLLLSLFIYYNNWIKFNKLVDFSVFRRSILSRRRWYKLFGFLIFFFNFWKQSVLLLCNIVKLEILFFIFLSQEFYLIFQLLFFFV